MFTKEDKLRTKLNRFYKFGKYTDITIVCKDKRFEVHRLILALKSDYFDALFGNDFKEKTQKCIQLHHVSPEAFEEVLRFVYTGHAILTPDNVLDVLSTSEYLQMSDLQNLCVEFTLKRMPQSLSSALDVFVFACRTKMNALIRKYGEYLAEHIDLVEMPGSDFLLEHVSSTPLSPKKEEMLLTALIRWSCNSREDKQQYFHELIKLLPFDNVSVEFRSYLYEKFIDKSDVTCLTRIIELADDQDMFYRETDHSLHVFVEDDDEISLKNFSIDSAGQCAILNEIPRPYVDQAVRITTLDNSFLYCLNFHHNYALLRKKYFRQIFSLHTSIDMRVGTILKSPPLQVWDIELCGLKSNVYLYDQTNSSFYGSDTDFPESPLFNQEEIRRGIYAYNSEVDNWFPVPRMKKQVAHACMTACGDTVFVIGGVAHETGSLHSRNAQAYDARVGKWRELPLCNYEYEFATCCALKSKIYVIGYAGAEVYDQVAGKWEIIESANGSRGCLSRAVSYANKIWVMHYFTLDINVYEPELNEWSVCRFISDEMSQLSGSPRNIVEAVVFKSLYD